MFIDLAKIEALMAEERYSENLGNRKAETFESLLASKVEAAKWCLGLQESTLNYHLTASNGALISNRFATVAHTAEEDFEVGSSIDGSAGSSSVIEEAKFMQQLGNQLKGNFKGLSFQQFSSPMRRMRGAGGSGWSLHNTGEAIDLFYSNKSALTDWLIQNASALRLKVIIDYANQRSWNSSRKDWKSSSKISTSYNHIHIDRGGYRNNGQGLSPEDTLATNVRQIIGGL